MSPEGPDEDDDYRQPSALGGRLSDQVAQKQRSSVIKLAGLALCCVAVLGLVVGLSLILYRAKIQGDRDEALFAKKQARDEALTMFRLCRTNTDQVYFDSTEEFKQKYSKAQFEELFVKIPLLKTQVWASEIDPHSLPVGTKPNRTYTSTFELSDDTRLQPFVHHEEPAGGWPKFKTMTVTVVMNEGENGIWKLDQLRLDSK